MSAPALKDLPTVDVTLKSQLEGFNQDKLKDVDTQVKVVLPTAEGNYYRDSSFSGYGVE